MAIRRDDTDARMRDAQYCSEQMSREGTCRRAIIAMLRLAITLSSLTLIRFRV
jgi:hypothetical protein